MTAGSGDINARIFQLGQECYIIYLGSDRDDENPFLRIGNVPDIPEELHEITSRIIITSSFTGNPFQEVEYARKHKLSYLGDVDVIDHFRKFFQSLNLPARELTDYRQIKDAGNRHTLYFYNNGNIHLNFDGTLLFDLQKREVSDLHCLQRCDEIKKLFLKNPLRYTREELNRPGFFVSRNGKFYLYHKEWMALDLENHFFGELASQGIDPDEVQTVFSSVPEEKMSYQDRESLVQHIKRRVLRKKDLTILTTRPEIPEHLIRLFPDGGTGNTSPVKPVLLKPGTGWEQSDMKAEVLQDILQVHFGSENALYIPFGKGEPPKTERPGWHISSDRKTLTWRPAEGGEIEIETLRGYPLLLEKKLPDLASMTGKYLGFLHSYLEAWESRDNWQAYYDLENQVEKALAGLEVSVNIDDFSKLSPSTPGLEYLFLSNAVELLKLAKGDYGQAIASLKGILSSWEKPSVYLPVLGDLYHGYRDPFVLYRITTHKLNPYNLKKAEEIARDMSLLEKPDQNFFQKERKRLEDLLSTLYGKSPSLLRAASAAAAPAAENKPALPKKTPSKPEEKKYDPFSEDTRSRTASRETSGGPSGFSGGTTARTSKRKRSLLPLWIILALLLLGGGIYGFVKVFNPFGSPAAMTMNQNQEKLKTDGSGEQASGSGSGEKASGTGDSAVPASDDRDGTSETAFRGQESRDGSQTDENSPASGAEETDAAEVSAESSGRDAREGAVRDSLVMEGADGNRERPEHSVGGEQESSGKTEGSDDALRDLGSNAGDTIASGDTDAAEESGTPLETAEKTPPVVETERRPETVEEAVAYLKVEDIRITLVDIHLVSNEIAVRNGYHDLDYRVYEGKDPDWIWAGNVLELPDGSRYEVVKGDTIWFIAARHIRRDIEDRLDRLQALQNEWGRAGTAPELKNRIISELDTLAAGSLSEELRSKILSIKDEYRN